MNSSVECMHPRPSPMPVWPQRATLLLSYTNLCMCWANIFSLSLSVYSMNFRRSLSQERTHTDTHRWYNPRCRLYVTRRILADLACSVWPGISLTNVQTNRGDYSTLTLPTQLDSGQKHLRTLRKSNQFI